LVDGSTIPAHTGKGGYSYGHGVTEMVQDLMPKAWWSRQGQGASQAGCESYGDIWCGGWWEGSEIWVAREWELLCMLQIGFTTRGQPI